MLIWVLIPGANLYTTLTWIVKALEWGHSPSKCNIKPQGGGILKIRGLGQGGTHIWPYILGMSITHGPAALPVEKHNVKGFNEPKHA
jgi:hypothetical protein